MRQVELSFLCLLFVLRNGANTVVRAQETRILHEAAGSATFIYEGNTLPCAVSTPSQPLLPIGSGFVVGISQKGAAGANWKGWKFLITCEHVIGTRTAIILRVNRSDRPEFTCLPLALNRDGNDRNIFMDDRPEVDLVAINIPDIPNTNPTIFDYSLILDEQQMNTLEVSVGSDVFTVGYLYGYSGSKQNFPVTKFGKIAMLTDELWYRSSRTIPITLTENQRAKIQKMTGLTLGEVGITPGILERAYLIEMQNTPGLSGAPILLQSTQFRVDSQSHFQFRRIPPYIVGVIKGLLLSPLGTQAIGSSGVTVVEPASNLGGLIRKIAEMLQASGAEVELEPAPNKKINN